MYNNKYVNSINAFIPVSPPGQTLTNGDANRTIASGFTKKHKNIIFYANCTKIMTIFLNFVK